MKIVQYSIPVAFATLASAINVNALDHISCERVKSTFKQFCYVNSNTFDDILTVDRKYTVDGVEYDLGDLFQNPSLILEQPNSGSFTYVLDSLRPVIDLNTYWNSSSSCAVSTLWQDVIYLQSINTENNQRTNIQRVQLGNTTLNGRIIESNIPLSNIDYDNVNNNLNISASFTYFNSSYVPGTPLAYQRIPLDCSLEANTYDLGFSATDLAGDLSVLEGFSDYEIQIKAAAVVQHASYVDLDNSTGHCVVDDMKDQLLALETELRNSNPFEPDLDINDLTNASRTMLVEVISSSAQRGRIDYADIPSTIVNGNPVYDFFGYLNTSTYEDNVSLECSELSAPNYNVVRDPFVTVDQHGNEIVLNQQGLNNVESYNRSKRNITEILKSAGAIINASEAQINNYTPPEWINAGALHN